MSRREGVQNPTTCFPSRRSSPAEDTYLYIVARVTPSSSHRSPTTVPLFPIAAAASRSFAETIFGLHPRLSLDGCETGVGPLQYQLSFELVE